MPNSKKYLLIILILVLGLAFSGCDLFSNVDEDDILKEVTIAGFLNDFINEFEDILQAYIDAAGYDEEEEEVILPQLGELDFSGLFSKIDYLRWWDEIPDEEELEQGFLDNFSYFLYNLVYSHDYGPEDLNTIDIQVNFRYKYYIESVFLAEAPQDFPKESLLFVMAMAIRSIYIEGEKVDERVVEAFLDLAKYDDSFKMVYLYYTGLFANYGCY